MIEIAALFRLPPRHCRQFRGCFLLDPAASATTAWRMLDEIASGRLRAGPDRRGGERRQAVGVGGIEARHGAIWIADRILDG